MTTAIQLRDYQRDAVNSTIDGFRNGRRRLLTVLPTGGGKTIVFAKVIARARGRSLVLAHREELLDQAREKIHYVTPNADVGIVQAHRDEPDADIVVGSVQTLVNPKRLDRIGDVDFIVIDEAHHAAAQSYRDILEHLGAFDDDGPYVMGVTATPDRGDGVGLSDIFEDVAYEIGMLDLMARGYLVDLRAKQVRLAADFSQVHSRGGDLVEGELGMVMLEADAPEQIAQAMAEHAADRRSIVFTPTVAVAEQTAAAIDATGIRAAVVSATTPGTERREMLEALRAGEIQAMVNCGVLTEGTDVPIVDCIVPARPTKSRAALQQMIGRGLRPYPGKRDCLVIDPVGATSRHDLVSPADLFGLPVDALANGESVTEAVVSIQQEAEAAPQFGHLVTIDIDLFNRSGLNWIGTRNGSYVLPAGSEIYALRSEGGDRWSIIRSRGEDRAIVQSGLPLEFAQGVAEDMARKGGVQVLMDRHAVWRNDPPSQPQVNFLRFHGVPTGSIATKGQASDLIGAIKAEQELQAIPVPAVPTREGPSLRDRVRNASQEG